MFPGLGVFMAEPGIVEGINGTVIDIAVGTTISAAVTTEGLYVWGCLNTQLTTLH
jgi:hypothetical protein